MSEFGHEHGNAFGHNKKTDEAGVDLASENSLAAQGGSSPQGSDLQAAAMERALAGAIEDPTPDGSEPKQVQPNADAGELEANHFSPDQLANARGLDGNLVERADDPAQFVGENGDLLDGKGGTNTIIAGSTADVIVGNTAGSFTTAATGFGGDLVVLGPEATVDVFDFDPAVDRFGISGGLTLEQIVYGQGQNPDKGGLDQPLDSENNTVILDRETGHTLATARFTNSEDFSESNFVFFEQSEESSESASLNSTEQA